MRGQGRGATALLALLAAAGVVGASTAAAVPSGATDPGSRRYVLRLDDVSGQATVPAEVRQTIEAGDGRIVSVLPAVHTLVVDVPAATAATLGRLPQVAAVTPDTRARPHLLGIDLKLFPGAMPNVTRLTGARTAWSKGYTGAGVDVAVIDTGVAPVPSLRSSDKVVVGPDLSFESQALNLRYLDTYGHGTHMASVIGGREIPKATGSTYAANTTDFLGMAPDARIISVKVGDHSGAADVSQLIAAIDWVVQNRNSNGLNIKILNLSFGTDSDQAYTSDPLSYAAEVAWNNGILVVASAGNDGRGSYGLADPAYNNNILAVGAVDTRGTDSVSDDTVPSFSQHPNSSLFGREPDILAPGVGIVGAGVPGSKILTSFPLAGFGNGLLRGSGTSQAAAVTSGAAALLYQKWPNMSPASAKSLLMRTTNRVPWVSTAIQGQGELSVSKALASYPYSTRRAGARKGKAAISNGWGSLERARGSFHVKLDGVTLTGERDIMSRTWSATDTSTKTRSRTMWGSDGSFNGALWIGGSFSADTTSWAGRTWSGRTWSGRTWSGLTWSGRTWSGRTWSGETWDGRTWSSASWSGDVDPSGFTAGQWSSAAWS